MEKKYVRDGREWVEIPATGYGDYTGTTVERSNNESLLKEFTHEDFSCRDFDNGYTLVWNGRHYEEESILIKYDTRIIEVTDGCYSVLYGLSGDPEIEDWIAALSDYPIVDEDELSRLEWELSEQYVEEEIVEDILRNCMDEADAYCKKYDCTEDDLKDDIREEVRKYINDNNMDFIYEQAYCAYLRDTEDVINAVIEIVFENVA